MSADNVRPDLVAQIKTLQAQVADLQRRRLPPSASAAVAARPVVLFSYPGNLTAGIESPRWYNDGDDLTLSQIRISLGTNASTDHVIQLHLDGSNIGAYTLPSGSSTVVIPVSVLVVNGHFLTVETITVGVTDSDLAVELV